MDDKIKKLIKDESFLEKMSNLSTKKEIKEVFSEEKITLTDSDVDFLYKTIVTKELPDEALENVAGGTIGSAIINITDGVIEIGTSIFKFFGKKKK